MTYELPLSRLIGQTDVDTDRYELGILRVSRLDPVSPEELQAAISATRAMTNELRTDATRSYTAIRFSCSSVPRSMRRYG